MNFKRICRTLVCFVLVCCLIVNISPIRAEAITAEGMMVNIVADNILASIFKGIGVFPGSNQSVFDGLINNCRDAISATYPVTNGMFSVFKNVRPGSNPLFAVPLAMVETVRNWLFNSDSPVLTLDNPVSSASACEQSFLLNDSLPAFDVVCSVPFIVQGYIEYFSDTGAYTTYYIFSSSLGSYRYTCGSTSSNSLNLYKYRDGLYYRKLQGFSGPISYIRYPCVQCSSLDELVAALDNTIFTDLDLELGSIAAPSDEFADGYADWAANSITVPGFISNSGDDEPYVPIGIGQDVSGTLDLSQGQIWAGEGTYVDSGTDTDTDTGTSTGTGTISQSWLGGILNTVISILSDILESVLPLPGLLGDVFSAVLTNLFAISDTFIQTKVEALTAKYPYLDTFLALGTDLKAFFLSLGTKPPIIYIDLGAATGSYFWGGRQVFLDLTWYAQYKPTMDAIIGAFIWLWLAWRVFHALPGIINGMSGTVGQRDNNVGTSHIYLPPVGTQKELPPGKNNRR